MTLIKNTITTTPSPAHADQKGTQIHPRTLRERRNVKRFTHLEPCPLALWSADERFMQPEGHLQATVIMPNISRKRGAPATAAPTAIPTPLSFPCTTITPHSPYNPPSPAYANQKAMPSNGPRKRRAHATAAPMLAGGNVDQRSVELRPIVMNIPRRRMCRTPTTAKPKPTLLFPCKPPPSLREHRRNLSIHLEHIIEELLKGYVQPEGQLQPPVMRRGGLGKQQLAPSPYIGKRHGITFEWPKKLWTMTQRAFKTHCS
ncbi:hypothetical protein C0989_001332 [Termitomyces sp. Mn162]|nr:hypothetical protein C0989_001332 [Termitomyces sp. Mn162]